MATKNPPNLLLDDPKTAAELIGVLKDIRDELGGIASTLIADRELFTKMNNDGETTLNHVKNLYKATATTERIIEDTVHKSMSEVVAPLTEEIESKKKPETKRRSFLLGLRDALAEKLTPRVKKSNLKP